MIQNVRKTTAISCRPAFTLLELLAVAAIVALLAALTIPVASKVRNQARSARCISYMREIGQAMLLYSQDNAGKLPVIGNASTNWVVELRGSQNQTGYKYLTKDDIICPINRDTMPPGSRSFNGNGYAMNYYIGGQSVFRYPEPAKTCLLGEVPYSNTHSAFSFYMNLMYRDATYPLLIHNDGYHFMFMDGHATSQDSYPTSPYDPFWGAGL